MRQLTIVLIGICLISAGGRLHPLAEQHLSFSCKVTDKHDKPVPNAKISLVAITEDGKPYGPTFTWSMGMGTDMKGRGDMGFGSSPAQKPGKLKIIARHPSIQDAERTVDWSTVLHVRRPLKSYSDPVITLKSKGGPGIEAWRKAAAKRAPDLVKQLMKAGADKDVMRITKQIVAGEMCSIPPLVPALEDFKNPRRGRLVRALIWSWNGCMGRGLLPAATMKKAYPIYRVHSYLGIIAMKPRTQPTGIIRHGKQCAAEVKWVIKDLQSQIAAEKKKEGRTNIGTLEMQLARMQELDKQIEKAGQADE